MSNTLLIVDDHALVRSGIKNALGADESVSRVDEAADAQAAYRLIDERAHDLVLMDLMLPGEDGISATREIRRRCPDTRVLVLSGFQREDLAVYAFEAGAAGIVCKSQSPDDLKAAVRMVLRGGRYLSPVLDPEAVAELMQRRARNDATEMLDSLSGREREVLQLQTHGMTARQIAHELTISEKTVQAHRGRILRKLNVRSTIELVRLVTDHGLFRQSTH
jgi:two-component system response regulator NreC